MATQTRNPTSEVSVTGTWSGTNRHLLLDDHPDSGNPIADGTTHGTAAGEGLFGFSAFTVPAGSSAISVQVIYYDFKNGSQSCNIRARIRCNDTTGRDAPGGTHNPGNGNANIALRTDDYGANNPKTAAAWTVDDVNGVGTNGLTAFGFVSTDANPTITVSSIILQVTYTAPVTGDLAATDPQDTAAATGTVAWHAALAATEAQDTAAFTGTVSAAGITGDLAATDQVDAAAGSGTVAWYAALAATEAQDAASAGATVAWYLAMVATDPQDTASMDGDVTGGAPAADEFIVDMMRSRRRSRILKAGKKFYKEKP